MARDDDPWKRLRDREEEEANEAPSISKKRGVVRTPAAGAPVQAASTNEKLIELVERATPMIEQLNNLYNQYFAGAEKIPPNERRKQLEQIMASIAMTSKPTPALQFRCQTLNASYLSARDRWDRMAKDFEKGKLKRR